MVKKKDLTPEQIKKRNIFNLCTGVFLVVLFLFNIFYGDTKTPEESLIKSEFHISDEPFKEISFADSSPFEIGKSYGAEETKKLGLIFSEITFFDDTLKAQTIQADSFVCSFSFNNPNNITGVEMLDKAIQHKDKDLIEHILDKKICVKTTKDTPYLYSNTGTTSWRNGEEISPINVFYKGYVVNSENHLQSITISAFTKQITDILAGKYSPATKIFRKNDIMCAPSADFNDLTRGTTRESYEKQLKAFHKLIADGACQYWQKEGTLFSFITGIHSFNFILVYDDEGAFFTNHLVFSENNAHLKKHVKN